MGHLDGKTAIVTGAGTGMGKATAITYARQGAKVLAWDLGVDVEGRSLQNNPVDETVATIKEAGGEAIPFYGDVSSMSDSEDAVRTVIDTWGQLDILTCIAGILRERMVFNMIEEEWDDVGEKANTFVLTRLALNKCYNFTSFTICILTKSARHHVSGAGSQSNNVRPKAFPKGSGPPKFLGTMLLRCWELGLHIHRGVNSTIVFFAPLRQILKNNYGSHPQIDI